MAIRLIVTDIDGTFFDDAHHYDVPRFNQQLPALAAQGIQFAVASGNQLLHLKHIFAHKSPLKTFVAENGGHIVDGDHVITEVVFEDGVLQALLWCLNTDPAFEHAHLRLSGKQHTYLQEGDPTLADEGTQYYLHDIELVPDLIQVHDDIYKVNLQWDKEGVQAEASILNQQFSDDLHATPSGWDSIDIIPSGVNKAFGLTQLQHYWHLKPSEIMAFGDNFNDLEMLQHVKYGYVMQNASDAMHQFNLPVTPLDNNHSGVLDMLDRVLSGADLNV